MNLSAEDKILTIDLNGFDVNFNNINFETLFYAHIHAFQEALNL